MVKDYRVLERSFINGRLYEPGAIVSLHIDSPGSNLKPVKAQELPKAQDEPTQDAQPPNGTDAGAFKAFHVGGGRYGIKDGAGERVGEFTGSQAEAEAEAARMNGAQDEPTPGDLPDA